MTVLEFKDKEVNMIRHHLKKQVSSDCFAVSEMKSSNDILMPTSDASKTIMNKKKRERRKERVGLPHSW